MAARGTRLHAVLLAGEHRRHAESVGALFDPKDTKAELLFTQRYWAMRALEYGRIVEQTPPDVRDDPHFKTYLAKRGIKVGGKGAKVLLATGVLPTVDDFTALELDDKELMLKLATADETGPTGELWSNVWYKMSDRLRDDEELMMHTPSYAFAYRWPYVSYRLRNNFGFVLKYFTKNRFLADLISRTVKKFAYIDLYGKTAIFEVSKTFFEEVMPELATDRDLWSRLLSLQLNPYVKQNLLSLAPASIKANESLASP